MAIRLAENNYGKQRVRILQVTRHPDRHDIKEFTLGIRLEGDFETAHTKGENRDILPTDTMKNTVYALAKLYPIESPEEFCLRLSDHFLAHNPQISRVRIQAALGAFPGRRKAAPAPLYPFERGETHRRPCFHSQRQNSSCRHRRIGRIKNNGLGIRELSEGQIHNSKRGPKSHSCDFDPRELALQ